MFDGYVWRSPSESQHNLHCYFIAYRTPDGNTGQILLKFESAEDVGWRLKKFAEKLPKGTKFEKPLEVKNIIR